MATRVYVNVDQEPFCAELVFPKGLDVGGFVSLVFGPFGQEQVDGDHSQRHLSLRTGSKAGTAPVRKKVFISKPYGERQPLCTLRDAPLPDDLQDIPDAASDEEAVDDLILGTGDVSGSCKEGTKASNKEKQTTGRVPPPPEGLICPQCGGWFISSEVLQIHRALSHAKTSSAKVKALYGCKVCRKTFSTSADCLLHKWKHQPETEWPFQCKTCHRGFIRQAAFVRHRQSHTLECKDCNLTFEDHKALQEHNVTHQHGRETFFCIHCEQLFLSEAGLLRHIKRYHGGRGEPGAEASEGGDPESLPEAAARLDAIPVAHSCHLCTFGCSQLQELAQHVASEHPAVPVVRCDKCEQPFLKEEDLQEHRSLKHQLLHVAPSSDGNYVCHICQRKLMTFSGYWGHLRSHSKAKPFLCDQCGHRYASRGSLTKHKRTHDFANATKCPHCGKEFATLDYMRNHERLVHTRNFKFPCRLCGHRFPNERKMQTHMAVVHEQELSPQELAAMTRVRHQRCPDCPFATYSALQFRQHRASHTGSYPFPCTQCKRAFAFRFQLTLHVRRHHRSTGPLVCPHCPRRFVAEDAHAAHVALHGAPHAQGLDCMDCGRLFETPRLLDKHRKAVHAQGSPFSCLVCGKCFRSPAGMAAHHRVLHGGFAAMARKNADETRISPEERAAIKSQRRYGCSRWPFSCVPCGRFFKFESSLRAHRVCFHGIAGDTLEEKPCPECGKTFQTELTLSMHIRTHTREMSFKCSVCGKVYRSRCSLKKHVATVHRASLRCFCTECGRGFLSASSLALHSKFAHKDGCRTNATPAPELQVVENSSNPCRPEPYEPETCQPDLCQPDPSRPNLVHPCLCQADVVQPDLIQPDLTEPDLVQPNLVQPDLVQPELFQPNQIQPELNQPNLAQPNLNQPLMHQHDSSHPRLGQPERSLMQLSAVSEASEQAAMEQLLASVQPRVESAQQVLQMLSVSQVEEVVSVVGLDATSCPNPW